MWLVRYNTLCLFREERKSKNRHFCDCADGLTQYGRITLLVMGSWYIVLPVPLRQTTLTHPFLELGTGCEYITVALWLRLAVIMVVIMIMAMAATVAWEKVAFPPFKRIRKGAFLNHFVEWLIDFPSTRFYITVFVRIIRH